MENLGLGFEIQRIIELVSKMVLKDWKDSGMLYKMIGIQLLSWKINCEWINKICKCKKMKLKSISNL